ncbi:hypothetical protein ACFFHT_04285 [Gallibacterium melopsittaci]|uniref:Uncharacterized protein n=1 Tax=Gallibacterium melopsittaci TaxID=516063 RepID=A0ABV6HVL4_9PAST
MNSIISDIKDILVETIKERPTQTLITILILGGCLILKEMEENNS